MRSQRLMDTECLADQFWRQGKVIIYQVSNKPSKVLCLHCHVFKITFYQGGRKPSLCTSPWHSAKVLIEKRSRSLVNCPNSDVGWQAATFSIAADSDSHSCCKPSATSFLCERHIPGILHHGSSIAVRHLMQVHSSVLAKQSPFPTINTLHPVSFASLTAATRWSSPASTPPPGKEC